MKDFYKVTYGDDFLVYGDGENEVHCEKGEILHHVKDENKTFVLSTEPGEHILPYTDLGFKCVRSYEGWNSKFKESKYMLFRKRPNDDHNAMVLSGDIIAVTEAPKATKLTKCRAYLGGSVRDAYVGLDGEILIYGSDSDEAIFTSRRYGYQDIAFVFDKKEKIRTLDGLLIISDKDEKEHTFFIVDGELKRKLSFSKLNEDTDIELRKLNERNLKINVMEINYGQTKE